MKKKKENFVSDHALIRIAERVHGIDMEKIREDALPDRVKQACRVKASSIFYDGFTYMIRGGVVVTVIPGRSSSRPKKKN